MSSGMNNTIRLIRVRKFRMATSLRKTNRRKLGRNPSSPKTLRATPNIPTIRRGKHLDNNIFLLNSLYTPLPKRLLSDIDRATEETFLGKASLIGSNGGLVLKKDAEYFNSLSLGPLSSCLSRLRAAGFDNLIKIISAIYPKVLPFQIAGVSAGHFPHHTTYVMDHLSAILCGENGSQIDFIVGILSALFHDAGLAMTKSRKITEHEIRATFSEGWENNPLQGPSPNRVKEIWSSSIESRLEHAQFGAKIAEEIIDKELANESFFLSKDLIAKILTLITHHDDAKIPGLDLLMEDLLGNKWLAMNELPVDWFLNQKTSVGIPKADDYLLQWHYEADALWMLTIDGIEADLMRKDFPKRVTRKEMLQHNIKQHSKVVEIYRKALSDHPDQFEKYNFIENTHYRSKTGYAIFLHLKSIAEQWACSCY